VLFVITVILNSTAINQLSSNAEDLEAALHQAAKEKKENLNQYKVNTKSFY